ncbi:MAG TPA: hypothetical protein VL356_07955 [Acidocella sp.]|jgi:hypothetical protein|nr:hypothetical protein [Acidocella sp.]
MLFSRKVLPALILAMALAPLAAQAHAADAAAQTVRVSPIMPGSATIDHPTTVYSGVGVNSFPDSFGG